jgi:ABC-type glycerol-3-phosphate transport system substrate-binding protein
MKPHGTTEMSMGTGTNGPGATREWLSRRGVVRLAAGIASLGAAGLAACGGPAGSGQQSSGPKPGELKGVAIEHWIQNALTHPEGMSKEQVMKNFTAQNPYGAAVTSSGGQDLAKVTAAVTAGTPPDLVDGFHFNMSALFRQGATVDVDAELKGDAEWKKLRPGLYPEIANGFTWKGKLYAVPLYSSYFSMYFQPEHLKRAGINTPPPKTWTWDQFTDFAKRAARPPDVWGYEDQWSYPRTGMMVLNNGHRFLSQDGTKFSYNSPEAIEAVEYQLNLTKQGIMPPNLSVFPDGRWKELMPDGKVVFEFAVAARVPLYRQQGVQFGTTVFPLGPKNTAKRNVTHGESYGFAVFKNKDAKKQQAALQAALWGARPDSGFTFAKVGGTIPAYKHTIESTELQAAFKGDADVWTFYELLPTFVPMPNFPGFAEVRSMGDRVMQDIWQQKVQPRDALNEYTKQGQAMLDDVLK